MFNILIMDISSKSEKLSWNDKRTDEWQSSKSPQLWKFHEGNEQIDCIYPCVYELLDGYEQGDFENIIFSYANIADCKMAEKLAEVVKGTIFADAGYLQKKDVLKRMEEDWIKFEAAPNVPALFL